MLSTNENTKNTKKFNVTVSCMATYNSSINVPANFSKEEAIKYAREHLDEIPIGILEWVSDSEELDDELCEFEI